MSNRSIKLTLTELEYGVVQELAGFEPLASFAKRKLMEKIPMGDETSRGVIGQVAPASVFGSKPSVSTADEPKSPKPFEYVQKPGCCPHGKKIGRECFHCKGGIAK